MSRRSTPKALRQIEDCMNDCLFEVNSDRQLVFTHPDGFTSSEIEMLKLWFQKRAQQTSRDIHEA